MFLEVPQVKNCLTCVLQPFQTLFMVLEPGHICGKMQYFGFNLSVISVGCCKTLQEWTQPEFQPVFQLILKKKLLFFNSHRTRLPSCKSAWDQSPLTRFLSTPFPDPSLGVQVMELQIHNTRKSPSPAGTSRRDEEPQFYTLTFCLYKPLLLFFL